MLPIERILAANGVSFFLLLLLLLSPMCNLAEYSAYCCISEWAANSALFLSEFCVVIPRVFGRHLLFLFMSNFEKKTFFPPSNSGFWRRKSALY